MSLLDDSWFVRDCLLLEFAHMDGNHSVRSQG